MLTSARLVARISLRDVSGSSAGRIPAAAISGSVSEKMRPLDRAMVMRFMDRFYPRGYCVLKLNRRGAEDAQRGRKPGAERQGTRSGPVLRGPGDRFPSRVLCVPAPRRFSPPQGVVALAHAFDPSAK